VTRNMLPSMTSSYSEKGKAATLDVRRSLLNRESIGSRIERRIRGEKRGNDVLGQLMVNPTVLGGKTLTISVIITKKTRFSEGHQIRGPGIVQGGMGQ